MGVGTFGNLQITGSVFAHWADTFPLSVVTIYPSTNVDTVDLTEWMELWVNTWSRKPQRTVSREVIDVSITVHCFVRQGTNKARVHEIADAAKATLQHRQIVVADHSLSDSPTVGHLQLFETNARTLTRADADAARHTMQHVVSTAQGMATQF